MTKNIITDRVQAFMGHSQTKAVLAGMRGDERDFFVEKMAEMDTILREAPITYQTDGLSDAVIPVSVHLFGPGNADFYIIELDKGDVDQNPAVFPRQIQAFGLADWGQGFPELGYISVEELLRLGSELDLHFKPRSLLELKRESYPELIRKEDRNIYCDDDPAFVAEYLTPRGGTLAVYATGDDNILRGIVMDRANGQDENGARGVLSDIKYVDFSPAVDDNGENVMEAVGTLAPAGRPVTLKMVLRNAISKNTGEHFLSLNVFDESGSISSLISSMALKPNPSMLAAGQDHPAVRILLDQLGIDALNSGHHSARQAKTRVE